MLTATSNESDHFLLKFLFQSLGILISPLVFLSTDNLLMFRLSGACIILFFLPGFGIIIQFTKTIKFEQIIFSIVLSLLFWTYCCVIFLYFPIILNKLTLWSIFFVYNTALTTLFMIKNYKRFKEKKNLPFKGLLYHIFDKALVNNWLLAIFVVLLALFSIIRIPYVLTDDIWFHMAISRTFVTTKISNFSYYGGKFTYHMIGSLFSILTDIDILYIARFVPLFQITLGCSLFYLLAEKLFNNKNIALISTFLLSFGLSSLSFLTVLSQYWPTAICILFGLQMDIFFFKHMESYKETQSKTLKNEVLYYSTQTVLYFGIIFSHVINGAVFMLFYIAVLFIICRRDLRFIKELFFYAVLFGINFLVNSNGLTTLSSEFISHLNIWIIILIGAAAVIVYFFGEKFVNKYSYDTKSEKDGLFSPSNTSIVLEQKYYRKWVLPILIFSCPLVYIVMNNQLRGFLTANVYASVIDIIFIAILFSMSIQGLNFYREYNLVGKFNFIKLCIIILLLLGLIIIQFLYIFILRIVSLFMPFVFLGVGFYLLFTLDKWLKKKANKRILLVFCTINLFVSLLYQNTLTEHFSEPEIKFVQYSANNIPNDTNSSALIIGAFRWNYPYNYYSNSSVVTYDHHLGYLLHVENQTIVLNGVEYNQLQEIMQKQNLTNVYLVIEDRYMTQGIAELDKAGFGTMTYEEYDAYYEQDYLNCICVSNHLNTIFWVVPN